MRNKMGNRLLSKSLITPTPQGLVDNAVRAKVKFSLMFSTKSYILWTFGSTPTEPYKLDVEKVWAVISLLEFSVLFKILKMAFLVIMAVFSAFIFGVMLWIAKWLSSHCSITGLLANFGFSQFLTLESCPVLSMWSLAVPISQNDKMVAPLTSQRIWYLCTSQLW